MLKTPLFFFYKQGSLVRTFVGNSLGADANDNIFSCTVKVHYSLSFSITNIIMCCKFGILYKFLKTTLFFLSLSNSPDLHGPLNSKFPFSNNLDRVFDCCTVTIRQPPNPVPQEP